MPRKNTMGRAANGSGSIRKKTKTQNGKTYIWWEARITTGYDPGTPYLCSNISCRAFSVRTIQFGVKFRPLSTPCRHWDSSVAVELQTIDSIEQMLRRFNDITYCYKDGNAYKRYTIPMSDYRGMDVLRTDAMAFGDVLPFPDSKDEVGG